jgi:hypothetical protein
MENKDLRYQRLSRPDEMMLPVEEAQLREVLRLGLGRAILEAHRNDLRQFRDAILDACLHCYAVDAQSEGTRASYMHDFVGCLPDKDLTSTKF